jgi:transcriptional regulator with XRE-family HTH domain
MNDVREEVRCGKCLLNQFMTANRHCRKCKTSLDPAEPEPIMLASTEPSPLVDTSQLFISRRVRELRKLRCISQLKLSEIMNCRRTYISKVESGRAVPKLPQIERLALAFGITPYEFLLTPEELRRQNFLADPFLAEMAADLPKLSPDRRKEVLRFAGLLERQNARSS